MPISMNAVDPLAYQRSFDAQPTHFPLEMKERNALLSALLRPLEQARYTCHIPVSHFHESVEKLSLDYGAPVDMTPDFQRGHVWTLEQKKSFIKNVLRGAVPEAGFVVQFNCSNWDNYDYKGDLPLGFQCVDGLQRVTALREFMQDSFDIDGVLASDLEGSSFNLRRGSFNFVLQVFSFQSKKQLLAHYLDINSGGTPHSQAEIERVRKMMNETQDRT